MSAWTDSLILELVEVGGCVVDNILGFVHEDAKCKLEQQVGKLGGAHELRHLLLMLMLLLLLLVSLWLLLLVSGVIVIVAADYICA